MLLVVGLVACDTGDAPSLPPRSPRPEPTAASSRVIGLVGTMSGEESWRGESAFEGADVAVQVLNRRLAGDDEPFELVVRDDAGDPDDAARLVGELADLDKLVGVVYAGPPEALTRTEPALAEAGIPAILTSGDLYGVRGLRPHIFQASPPVLWQARRIASYLLRDRRYGRIGALVERSPGGLAALAQLRSALAQFGGRAPITVRYRLGADDLDEEIRSLRRRRPQALVVQGSPGAFSTTLAALRRLGSRYVTTRVARRGVRRGRPWRPQVAGFDHGMSPRLSPPPPAGTVAADSYARGAHYLPIPSLRSFRKAFEDWWSAQPLGWQRRAYEAALMIGWGAERAEDEDDDLARALETLAGRRFGGLDVTFGPDDHTSVDQTTVGLWVVPRPSLAVREAPDLPANMPWVPLSRGFSIDGERTDVFGRDWRYLFRKPPPPRAPAPRLTRMRFGVATRRSDPVH